MPDYSKGKIYMVYPNCDYDEGDIYYGSTIQTLAQRMTKHRCQNMIKPLADKYGLANLKIELVCEYKCETKEQLDREEGKYIRENKCINKNIAGRNRKEWREANKDKICEYYENNKEKIKEYYENNKDKICENKKEYYEKNKEKSKEYRETNKEKIKEYRDENKDKNKEWREANKDKIREYKKQWYLKKKAQ
tara:strand:+ start:40 stop:615 length:576 start_codon:yes stop_codon:yes gene_type:complete